jgi:anti-sigma B factor antagonist
MDCNIRTEGGFSIVALSGEVDLHYSPEARKQILEQLNKNNHVLVDLSGVSYIDSSGIASLVEGLQLARTKKLQFGLVGVSEAAQQVLQLARLDKVFPIKDSIKEFSIP